ncbi:hypothetical protein C8C77_105102 [Halanaerobium saccharolyticum]|uniref:Uncharacterized protein n=1 Tax=Halanaerobium saccharolyticum TaxID=43595 RepID=A0A4R7Z735_9FIRM|nr:hypothetical protein [Halanaerobium saccharolyticum]RAK12540.1 hypothetical protein C7958_101102 [Halanaerobium saccharolyticum]TDW06466.1 hypothetical protein C8C77_105102 [Halanaerobium saccharolyticum]TDX61714.1 hypothetical protein C7956_105102 [Halanaerobium saccharolyticum]
MRKEKYSEEELYQLLWQKAEEIEKVPGAREINSDPFLPDYEVFTDCFGNFRKSKRLQKLVEKFTDLRRKNRCFCIDCPQDENRCKKDVRICKTKFTNNELRLYFIIFDQIC